MRCARSRACAPRRGRSRCERRVSMNVAEPLAHHARASAHKPAIVQGDRVVTYGELDPLVRRTASHLRSLDLGQSDVAGSRSGTASTTWWCSRRSRARGSSSCRWIGAGRPRSRRALRCTSERSCSSSSPTGRSRTASAAMPWMRSGAAGWRRRLRRRSPRRRPSAADVALLRHHRPAQGAAHPAQPVSRPLPRDVDQPRFQQPGPVPLGDAALRWRRPHLRAPHAAFGRDRIHAAAAIRAGGALRSDRAAPHQRPLPGADADSASAGAAGRRARATPVAPPPALLGLGAASGRAPRDPRAHVPGIHRVLQLHRRRRRKLPHRRRPGGVRRFGGPGGVRRRGRVRRRAAPKAPAGRGRAHPLPRPGGRRPLLERPGGHARIISRRRAATRAISACSTRAVTST